MDSERRHELETNDLREFLDNFKDFWDKHGNRLLISLIVVLGAWLGYAKYNEWQADKAEAAFTQLNEADSADAFRALAGERSEVHDEAMRRGGDTALGDARTALISGEDADKPLTQAGSAYDALAKRGTTTEYQLVGQEGLAKVALMREEWDKAKKHYEQVIELAGDAFVTQADRAQRALDRIDLLKSPVAFAEPEAAVAPAPQPVEDDADSPKPALPLLPVPPVESE
ncbi:MAG: tetratricopeptide repeat protein [Phycisphaeraceae bacterium]